MPQPSSDARCRPITPPNRMQRAPARIPNQATCAFGVACFLHEEQAGSIHMPCTACDMPHVRRCARKPPGKARPAVTLCKNCAARTAAKGHQQSPNTAPIRHCYSTDAVQTRRRQLPNRWLRPKPKAQSPKPKAQSPKPKAQSPKPKAQKRAAQAPSMYCAVAWNRPIALLLLSAAIYCYLLLSAACDLLPSDATLARRGKAAADRAGNDQLKMTLLSLRR